MLVVSDTTPIISLMKDNRLGLLKDLFNEIVIPEAVYNELTSNMKFAREAETISRCDFIRTVSVDDRKVIDVFQKVTGLDLGESEAIIYSDENAADILLMDEVKGRQVAKQMNIRVIGTLGILQLANAKGLMTGNEVRHTLEILKASQRHISDALIEVVLANLEDQKILRQFPSC